MDKECTEFCCQFCSFQVEAWKRRLLKHRRPYIWSLQPACPHSVQCSLSGDASPTRPSAGPLQPTASIEFVFVVLPPSFVSPKLQVFNQRLIQNFLWMCPWTQCRHYAGFARNTIHCTSKLPTVSSVFSEHTLSKYSSNDSASAYCAAFL